MTRAALLGLRWSARISGLALVGLVLLFAIGQGLPNPVGQPLPIQLELLAMLLMLGGFVAGWRWETAGGGVAVAGFALFVAAEWAANGRLPGGAIPLLLIPGLLLLAAAALGGPARRRRDNAR